MLFVAITSPYATLAWQKGGIGYALALLIWAVSFIPIYLIGFLVFGLITQALGAEQNRWGFLALCFAAVFAYHGIPGLFAIMVGIVYHIGFHMHALNAESDTRALERFDTNGP